MPSALSPSGSDLRRDPRDDVHLRTRGTRADGRGIDLLVVNLSARGMMARCADETLGEGDRITVRLPDGDPRPAQIRWALGGRIGCEFDAPIELAAYLRILAVALR